MLFAEFIDAYTIYNTPYFELNNEIQTPDNGSIDLLVSFNSLLKYDYNGTDYQFQVMGIRPKEIKMRLFPQPTRDYIWTADKLRYSIDLDDSGDDDILVELKSRTMQNAIFRIRNLHPKEFNVSYFVPESLYEEVTEEINSVEEIIEPVDEKPIIEEKITRTFKDAVLDVFTEFIPSKKASPFTGAAISLGIIFSGLILYFGFRKLN